MKNHHSFNDNLLYLLNAVDDYYRRCPLSLRTTWWGDVKDRVKCSGLSRDGREDARVRNKWRSKDGRYRWARVNDYWRCLVHEKSIKHAFKNMLSV